MSYIYNFSKDSNYHTQINNKEIPYSACNVTSEAMGLIQASYNPTIPEGWQLEDYLMSQLLVADETHIISYKADAIEYAKKAVPWNFNEDGTVKYALNEVAVMIDWAANKVIGREVSFFKSNSSVIEMVQKVFSGYGVILSGVYTLSNGKQLSHITSLAGFISNHPFDQGSISTVTMDDITHMIIDDPYGNFYTNYTDHHGNNIQMPIKDFMEIQQECGKSTKWAHFITPNK